MCTAVSGRFFKKYSVQLGFINTKLFFLAVGVNIKIEIFYHANYIFKAEVTLSAPRLSLSPNTSRTQNPEVVYIIFFSPGLNSV